MSRTPPFLDEPTDTRGAIMRATYQALCAHGYADLTIQDIADEFEKSKSLLYHHYDGKDDLLLDFLSFMLERFEEQLPFPTDGGADEYLERVIERVLATPLPSEHRDFSRAMVELRAQAAHDPEYREHFTRSDAFFRKQLTHVVRAGVEEGVFRDVDPQATAAMLQAVVTGVRTQRVTTNEDTADAVRAEAERYLQACVLAEEE